MLRPGGWNAERTCVSELVSPSLFPAFPHCRSTILVLTMREEPDSEDRNHKVETGLHRIRALRAWTVGLIPGALAFIWFIGAVLKTPDWLLTVFAILAFCAFVVVGIANALARCPACHRFFHLRSFYGNSWSSKCLNCGISLQRKKANQTSDTTSGPAPGVDSSSYQG